jgi:hypothetical protein
MHYSREKPSRATASAATPSTPNRNPPPRLRQTGTRPKERRPAAPASRYPTTKNAAVQLSKIIERKTGRSVWVQGVVAVWGQLPEGVVEHDKVLYVPAGRLVETLEARAPNLAEVRCEEIRAAIASLARR